MRHRKADRIAAAYGVAAWLIVQGASIALPTFGAPAWVLKVLIVAAIAGFPLTIFVAWHAAPHSHHRRNAPPQSATAADTALLALLGSVVLLSLVQFALGIGLLPRWWSSASERGTVRTASLGPGENAAPAASIAVLPFLNMSGDPKKEYFSDGISEELLNDLANAPNLRVAARTSSFAFKGKSEDIRKIARALNVRSVLEGSVREDGQHIRITAQLIDAADGYHLWSKTYDRDLSNVLTVQDEIAREITAALTHELAGKGQAQHPNLAKIDPAAYRKYLEGQFFAAKKTDDGDERAADLFRQVTAAQPDFAPGFASLGRTYLHMAEFHHERADFLNSAETSLNEAIKLDPKNLEALSTHLILMLAKWDWQAASGDAHRLQAINPHSVFTLRGLFNYYGNLGFPREQAAIQVETTKLDPLSFVDLNNLASVYNYLGEYGKAAAAANAALLLQPDRPLTLYTLCWSYAGAKRLGEARTLAARLAAVGQKGASDACTLRVAAAGGQKTQAHEIASRLAAQFPVFLFDETEIADLYVLSGDIPAAVQWFKRAYKTRAAGLFATQYYPTSPRVLLGSPGWKAVMSQPEAKEWQSVHDRLAAKVSRP